MRLIFFSLVFLVLLNSIEAIEWNEVVAERQLMYSYAAYCNERDILSWSCDWCKKTPRLQSIEYLYDFLVSLNVLFLIFSQFLTYNLRPKLMVSLVFIKIRLV